MKPGNFCDVSRPVYVSESASKALTLEQKRVILAHNEYGVRACGWKP